MPQQFPELKLLRKLYTSQLPIIVPFRWEFFTLVVDQLEHVLNFHFVGVQRDYTRRFKVLLNKLKTKEFLYRLKIIDVYFECFRFRFHPPQLPFEFFVVTIERMQRHLLLHRFSGTFADHKLDFGQRFQQFNFQFQLPDCQNCGRHSHTKFQINYKQQQRLNAETRTQNRAEFSCNNR